MYDNASSMSPLYDLASTVLKGEDILKYRQLINHPTFGQVLRNLLLNELGRLSQGVSRRKNTKNIHNIVCQQKVSA